MCQCVRSCAGKRRTTRKVFVTQCARAQPHTTLLKTRQSESLSEQLLYCLRQRLDLRLQLPDARLRGLLQPAPGCPVVRDLA